MLKNKKLLTITSLLILLPILAGVCLWNMLPDELPTHWGVNGEVDGWSSKGFAVFGLPAFLLAVHWICIFATRSDPKKYGHNEKMLALVLWICPAISVLCNGYVYSYTLGIDLGIEMIVPVLLGVLFIIIGNYMPKCKQNYTMGIKLPWTLNDEDNWNKTHRLAGKVWVIGGIVILLSSICQIFWIYIAMSAVMIIVPCAYSWILYHNKTKE